MSFYDDMQDVATELLAEFAQGTVSLKRVVQTPAENEWESPTETATTYPLSAAVKRLHHRYEAGALIAETGDMVSFSVSAVTPLLTDKLVIDGVERVITELTPIPAAGTVVAWKAWCAL